jgi:hypothetical protein
VPLLHSTARRNPILDEYCLNDRAISLSSFVIAGVLDLDDAVQADKGQHILKRLFRFSVTRAQTVFLSSLQNDITGVPELTFSVEADKDQPVYKGFFSAC